MTSATASARYCSAIGDSRWFDARVEPFHFADTVESSRSTELYSEKPELGLTCTICNSQVGEDRNDLITHYKSDWHRHNLRRVLQGRPLLTEDEFEQKISDNEEVSSLDTESDEDGVPLSEGAHAYFICDGTVYSIYRCILMNNETVSDEVFRRPLNCAVFLLAGGHFCGGIFKNDNLVVHKSFHRYVVRAKQGGLQSASDARGTKAKSSGASLRRYNEKALKDEIQSLLASWAELLEETPLIFLRCSTLQRHIFFEKSKNYQLNKTDERLRTVPFGTRRPTVDELQQTWTRLKVILSHGTVDNFNEEMLKRKKLRKRRRHLVRRKISEGAKNGLSVGSSSESADDDDTSKVQQSKEVDKEKNESIERKQIADDIARVSKTEAQAIYSAVRLNSVSELHQVLDNAQDRQEDLLKYIRDANFPPAASTFLHIASRRGTVEILNELLLLGCDPAVKDSDGKVPYQLAQNRAVRQAFSKFRSEHLDAFNWNASQVPELVVLNEEHLAREAEKRRIQREKKKQRDKAKKAALLLKKAEQDEREKYLALSDPEKKVLVAERRLPTSLQTLCKIVENDGNRCFMCGTVLDAKPFEYCDCRFCSLPCLQQHRQQNPPQLTP